MIKYWITYCEEDVLSTIQDSVEELKVTRLLMYEHYDGMMIMENITGKDELEDVSNQLQAF